MVATQITGGNNLGFNRRVPAADFPVVHCSHCRKQSSVLNQCQMPNTLALEGRRLPTCVSPEVS